MSSAPIQADGVLLRSPGSRLGDRVFFCRDRVDKAASAAAGPAGQERPPATAMGAAKKKEVINKKPRVFLF
jgi:hypothetical protein